ncbi:MAG: lysylphosphatidylglycerol synthase transmembrane domain-containing protein [Blastocatellales bacterium]
MNHPIKHLFTVLRAALGVGLLYYVLKVTGGWGAVKQMVSTVWLLPCLAMLTIFGAAFESKRLGFLFRAQDMLLPFVQGYRVVAIGALFNFCIPGGTGGDVMKLYYLAADKRGRRVEIATILFVDRVVALLCMLCLVVALALLEGNLVWNSPLIGGLVSIAGLIAIGLMVGGVVACSTTLRASRWYAYSMDRLPLSRYLARAADALYVFRKNKAALAKAAAFSFVGHLTLLGVLVAAGRALMPNAPALAVCFLALLGLLANAMPITPGGLGVGEAAFEGLFRSVGYSGGARLILAWRAGALALCLVGCAFYVAGSRRVDHLADQASAASAAASSS